MLAVSTTEALSILDPATLKNSPESLLSAHPFSEPPTASVWSQDNNALFVAFQDTIHQFSSAGLPVSRTFSTEEPVTCLIAKDKGQSLVFGAGNSVHVLDYASGSGKISQTFASHKAAVNSLSLSNDGNLLASTSSSSACVHNLSMSSHTVLRGLPQTAPITTCAFHPHSRTRLLLGMGKQVVIYDTTRPSGPLKLVTLSDATSGDVVALACSPFSKTLVAVATSGGSVGLIDLDKEKGLFRTLNLKMPLTSATFSPEGATLYFGTENGKILIVDLRGLDKPPRCITIGEGGHRVECISFQKKIKASTKPASISKAATSSPARARAKMGVVSAASPARLVRKTATHSAGKAVATPIRATKPAEKKVFSPVRDPLGNGSSAGDISVQMETLGSLRKKDPRKDAENPNGLYGKPRRPSSQLSHSRVTPSSGSSGLEVPRVRTRDRAGSSSSRLSSISRTTSRPASRATSSLSREPSPELPSMQPLSAFSQTTSGQRRARSRTPSPELLDEQVDPATPVAMAKTKKRTGLGVLGLGTPEVERWIEAGKGKAREDDERGNGNGNGRRVGFKEAEDSEGKESSEDEEPPHLTMQLSPRRAPPPWAQAPMPSPLRTLSAGVSNGNSPSSASAAHNLLRTIMADVMYDYQRDTKSEMMGLHLDLVRMGRNIKKELRESMEGGAGELERLREENRMLREENERLRRGY